MSEAITANRLRDGAVVWLTVAGTWSERVSDARRFDAATIDAGLVEASAAETQRLVVGAYRIGLVGEAGDIVPASYREQIRALGPTVRRDLGIQADAGVGLDAVRRAAETRG